MRRLILVWVMLVLVGCATSYAPKTFWNDGGFTETEVQPGLFMVRFAGNEFTTPERTADLAMLRAAELCLNQRKSFMYLGDLATKSVQTSYIPGSSTTTTNVTAYGTGNTATAQGYSQTTVSPPTALYSPETGLTVACSEVEAEGAWDAAFLANAMRTKYEIVSD